MRLEGTPLLGVVVAGTIGGAMAQGAAAKSWNFQDDKADAPPAGFSFGRTGSGRAGKWVVRVDEGAPAGDHDDDDLRPPRC